MTVFFSSHNFNTIWFFLVIITSKCSAVRRNLRCFSPKSTRTLCNSSGVSKSSTAVLNANPVLKECAKKWTFDSRSSIGTWAKRSNCNWYDGLLLNRLQKTKVYINPYIILLRGVLKLQFIRKYRHFCILSIKRSPKTIWNNHRPWLFHQSPLRLVQKSWGLHTSYEKNTMTKLVNMVFVLLILLYDF